MSPHTIYTSQKHTSKRADKQTLTDRRMVCATPQMTYSTVSALWLVCAGFTCYHRVCGSMQKPAKPHVNPSCNGG